MSMQKGRCGKICPRHQGGSAREIGTDVSRVHSRLGEQKVAPTSPIRAPVKDPGKEGDEYLVW